jgi:hypothetical protein
VAVTPPGPKGAVIATPGNRTDVESNAMSGIRVTLYRCAACLRLLWRCLNSEQELSKACMVMHCCPVRQTFTCRDACGCPGSCLSAGRK